MRRLAERISFQGARMTRGRLVFWSISGMVIAAGIGAILWIQFVYLRQTGTPPDPAVVNARKDQMARDDKPPRAWTPRDLWWKQNTIDAFDRVNAGKSWPSARRAVVAWACERADDPPVTGDEAEEAVAAADVAVDYQCDDPLVLFIQSREKLDSHNPGEGVASYKALCQSADALYKSTAYPPFVRCIVNLEVAVAAASRERRISAGQKSKASEYFNHAVELLPAVGSDPHTPIHAILDVVEEVGKLARGLGHDRMKEVEVLLAAMEKAGCSKSAILCSRGVALVGYAWDARGGGWAGEVTDDGWKLFGQRLAQARAALTEAWELDATNSKAASEMITVCMGQSAPREEVNTWFTRAITADPGNYAACTKKMLVLEPKWGGSVPAMIQFARELTHISTDPRAVRIPLKLVEMYWGMASVDPLPMSEFFSAHPELWTDIQPVYEKYLQQVPESRFHRTRYALIAAWSGHWDIAAAQFDKLGDNYSRRVVSESVIKSLREMAAKKGKTKSV
jgi:hypothetical protein